MGQEPADDPRRADPETPQSGRDGRMTDHVLNLSKVHFVKRHGSIMAFGTWLKTNDGYRPCLVLIRVGDERSEHCIPCIVTMDNIWVWTEEVGDEVKCGEIVAGFLDYLRLSPTKKNAFKILDVVRNHIGDVLSIPPRPRFETVVTADMVVTNNETGQRIETEVTEDV
jgi:hypothetical protein